eukprot:GHRR01032177.1.p1 GENE.GHRR01032177.1~~GHRR01032177.1.p1  ORF type:complete len:147 (+),score=15.84 GHRR01032177.1:323-763(+)
MLYMLPSWPSAYTSWLLITSSYAMPCTTLSRARQWHKPVTSHYQATGTLACLASKCASQILFFTGWTRPLESVSPAILHMCSHWYASFIVSSSKAMCMMLVKRILLPGISIHCTWGHTIAAASQHIAWSTGQMRQSTTYHMAAAVC